MRGGMNWEQEWRTRVTDQLDEIAERQQTASVIQERMLGILNAYDSRIKALEEQPAKAEAKFLGITGLSINAVWAAMSIISFFAVVVSPHWH